MVGDLGRSRQGAGPSGVVVCLRPTLPLLGAVKKHLAEDTR